jgi:PAS domain S-box-containing protein
MSEMLHILIIEDMPTDAELCEREVRKALPESRFLRVETREDFLAALETFEPALIISDYKLPRFDGLTALTLALERVPQTPFIILTGSMNEETAVACMKAGAWDYVIKEHIRRLGPAVLAALEQKHVRRERRKADEALRESEERHRDILRTAMDGVWLVDEQGKLLGVNESYCRMSGYSEQELLTMRISELEAAETEDKVVAHIKNIIARGEDRFESRHRRKDGSILDVEVSVKCRPTKEVRLVAFLHDITERKLAEDQLRKSVEQLRRSMQTTIQVLVMAVEIKDPYTAGHQRRMTGLARTMATEMGLPSEKIEGLRLAGIIHDIGKITLPTEILSKPTKLSAIELSLIREHVRLGHDILKDVESPWPLAEMVLQHHERTDGSGYPRGLKGEEILIEARILAVADVVEAMASHRPYRAALGLNAALEEIENNRGLLYDSHAVDTCLRLFREKGYQIEGA